MNNDYTTQAHQRIFDADALYVSIHILETQGLITRETATYMSGRVAELESRINNLIDSVNEMDKTIAMLNEQQRQKDKKYPRNEIAKEECPPEHPMCKED